MPEDATTDARAAARRFTRASAAGGALALVVFTWMLTNARWDLFARQPFGGIHDAQARSLFHGRWDVPLDVVGIEGFKIGSRYYTYFGPFPALLRMPVLLVTDRFDGRLTIVSMMLALVVLLFAASDLHWQVRRMLRGDAAVSTGEAVWAGVFTFATGAGSIVAFLASRGLVYHEVELWGIAWAVATAAALTRFAGAPARRWAVVASVCAVAAMMTRVSVGVASIGAVTIVAFAQGLRRFRARDDRPARGIARFAPGADTGGRWHLAALVAGVVVGVALYAGVNVARFGSPYQLPLDKQVFTQVDAQRRAALAANGGSLFGTKFLPTDLVQYARPDAIRPSSRFPWVDFPSTRATVIGRVTFDTIDRSSSIPASMPGFTLLAVVGLVTLVRPRRADATVDLARLWPPIIGGVVGTAFVLTIAFVAHRYLADFFPPLLFAATIGSQRLVGWVVAGGTSRRRALTTAGIAFVFVVGAWSSFGLGRVYQRPVEPGDRDFTRGSASVVRP